MNENALSRYYLPTNASANNAFLQSGETTSDGMVPLASVVSSKWVIAPPSLQRFNGFAAMQIVGSNNVAAGYSSGDAIRVMTVASAAHRNPSPFIALKNLGPTE